MIVRVDLLESDRQQELSVICQNRWNVECSLWESKTTPLYEYLYLPISLSDDSSSVCHPGGSYWTSDAGVFDVVTGLGEIVIPQRQ
ncbi:Hypothetical predicted protein [Octopus vulgaris]|uniref:Uncharacterized protein n=1 Tax=Octopus vulgaris TaxID=6645 RepID=A0AA36FDP9_OCTVU|nr:Hypothetical predicted protein [Octopus vulgaris]